MIIQYQPKGVCARALEIEVEEDKIKNIEILGGCAGNLLGLRSLLLGMPVAEAIEKLEGIPCGAKTTSCPDQIAKALKEQLA